jgi:stearoyl-CoA desaturase (delta-9 desaturase)
VQTVRERSDARPDSAELVAAARSLSPPSLTVWLQRIVTGIIVFGPLAALAFVAMQALGGGMLSVPNVCLAAVLYLVSVIGITVGFHRLFTHRSFEAGRVLKILLAIAGSLSLQGSIIGWVAAHRRHHMYSDRSGDPHSPVRPKSQSFGRLRGLAHAHIGWFFQRDTTSQERFAPDLLADRDIVLIDRMFVALSVATLALPFAFGYVLTGTVGGAFAALVCAGVLRIAFLHHVTWSTNSLCHTFGRRPFRTKDSSANFAPLAVLSMGESWHNAHHAFPSLARHGVDRHQLDISAELIRVFERLGWATRVRWPDPARLDARRTTT